MPVAAERSKIMGSCKKSGAPPHGLHIQRFSQLPHIAAAEYIFLCPHPDTVAVVFFHRRKAAVESFIPDCKAMNGNIIRQSPVPGILQHFQVIFLLQMDIGILPQGMDTGISPSGANHLPLGPGNPLQRLL